MRAKIVQIGKSRGIRIPKTLLEKLKIEESVEFEVLPYGLLLRPVHNGKVVPARAGWGEMFEAALAENVTDDSDEFEDWERDGFAEFVKEE